MIIENERYMLFFCSIDVLGIKRFKLLNETFGSLKAVYEAEDEKIKEALDNCPDVATAIIERRKGYELEAEYERIKNMGIEFYSLEHEEYPKKLLQISDPPLGLFVKGHLPKNDTPAIAIVGSRLCSEYGRAMSLKFAKEFSNSGIDVISGMASGVDGYAHIGALEGEGTTYAVLGCGVDICYPTSNKRVYDRIIEKGGVISEYYPGTVPLAMNFPRRNRIISALSDGVLVVEAKERSGSLITVDMGLEQGKDIFAVPGKIGDALSLGCNRIIRQGARLVTDPADVVAELAPKYGFLVDRLGQGDNSVKKDISEMGFNPDQASVYGQLSYTPVSPTDLAMKTGLDCAEILGALSLLEIRGLARNAGGGCYVVSEP